MNILVFFAETSASGGGIEAFNINLKAFLFQLVTFVMVLFVFKKWVFPKLTATMEQRRKVLEESLKHAKATEQALAKAEVSASEILQKAREQANQLLKEAEEKSKEIIAGAEAAAQQQAERIILEAKEKLGQEHIKLRGQLKAEVAELVMLATRKVMGVKINDQADRKLVEAAVKELE